VPSPNRPVGAGGGEISIDKQKREVLVRGEPVDLTPTEYDLLLLLAENAGTVLEHEVLLRGVWGQEYTKDNDYLKSTSGICAARSRSTRATRSCC
jgi:two-component system, OmpR family, KDP operon response regulator KdpE